MHRNQTVLLCVALLILGVPLTPVHGADCNGNGIADAADIAAGTCSDCQGNGVPDACDLPGDFNGDGAFDDADLPMFATCMSGPSLQPSGLEPAYADPCCVLGDFEQDGAVDLGDFAWAQRAMAHHGVSVIISEFVASNDHGLTDEDGDHADWIELYNPYRESVNLNGWYLTDDADDLMKWRLPDVTLARGEFLIIFASDKDRAVAGAPLHTNFKLSAAGEYLALVRPDGATVTHAFTPQFPPQSTDAAFGLAHSAHAGAWRFFDTPTPGAVNPAGFEGLTAAPVFSEPAGTIEEAFNLALASPTPGAVIRYTLDGVAPTLDHGQTYSGELTVTTTTRVRARAFAPGCAPSALVSAAYVALAPDAVGFNSNLPLVVLDTFGVAIPCEGYQCDASDYLWAYGVFIDTDPAGGGRAALTGPADFAGNTGVRIRGHSSTMFPKKQYALETWDEANDDRDVSVLGFPADSDWVLYAPYSDKTLLRNVLAYQWSNALGRYAPRTRCVEVFLNTDGGPVTADDYAGVYVFMEKIKRGTDRVNIAKLGPGDNVAPEITGGYMLKRDWADAGDVGFPSSIDELLYVEPKPENITPEQAAWIQGYIAEFENTLYGANYADPVNGYVAYIDVDTFIDHHILVEALKNVDGYRLSTFMYKDRGGKLCMGPIWDYNLCMGNADYMEWNIDWYQKATGWYYAAGHTAHNWYSRLMQDPNYRQRYADRWFELRRGVFESSRVLADIDTHAALLAESAARNFDRWKVYANRYTGRETGPPYAWTSILNAWIWPNWYHGTPNLPHTYAMEIDWLKTWIAGNGTPPGEYADRLAWFDANLGIAPPPTFDPQGGAVDPGTMLTITPPVGFSGTLYYTLNGPDPRIASQASVTLVAEDAAKRVLIPTGPISGWTNPDFADQTWTAGTGGVGYETQPTSGNNFSAFIGIDTLAAMYGANSTCLIRVPFESPGGAAPSAQLVLSARYDDAFVAYLNGVEIARSAFAPATPAWNSAATYYHDDDLAVALSTFDVSAHAALLRDDAPNLLAIHALNSNPTSSDFLFGCTLTIGSIPDGVSPAAMDYGQTGPITLAEDTLVRARVYNGSDWSALATAAFQAGPAHILINEFMADNGGSVIDPDEPGDYPDWIELYNAGPLAIELGGMYLTDDLDDPTQWPIPDGITIPAGGYLVFWADDDTDQGPLHAGFKLSKSGEAIGLFGTDADGNAAIDTLGFGPQQTDVSFGRRPDGTDTWAAFTGPTPGAANGP